MHMPKYLVSGQVAVIRTFMTQYVMILHRHDCNRGYWEWMSMQRSNEWHCHHRCAQQVTAAVKL